jgi:hypothetical protein
MGCKGAAPPPAQTTVIAAAMARICNAADRPRYGCTAREGLNQHCPKRWAVDGARQWQFAYAPEMPPSLSVTSPQRIVMPAQARQGSDGQKKPTRSRRLMEQGPPLFSGNDDHRVAAGFPLFTFFAVITGSARCACGTCRTGVSGGACVTRRAGSAGSARSTRSTGYRHRRACAARSTRGAGRACRARNDHDRRRCCRTDRVFFTSGQAKRGNQTGQEY